MQKRRVWEHIQVKNGRGAGAGSFGVYQSREGMEGGVQGRRVWQHNKVKGRGVVQEREVWQHIREKKGVRGKVREQT